MKSSAHHQSCKQMNVIIYLSPGVLKLSWYLQVEERQITF